MPYKSRSFILISILFVALLYTFCPKSEGSSVLPNMKRSLALSSMLGLGQAALVDYSQNKSDIRMNQIQVVGTHNSYHREINITTERDAFERFHDNEKNLYYSHANLDIQLDHQSVRSLELDLHSDVNGGLYADPLLWRMANLTNETIPFHDPNMTKPGLKVFHVTDGDPHSVCHTFLECLWQLRGWSESNPGHLPILIDLELKMEAPACGKGGICDEEALVWTLERILNVDSEIHSVLSPSQLITPDDVRQGNLTLEQSVLQHGWPTLESARGKFMFFFDNEPDSGPPAIYTSDGHESLQNRTIFTNGVEGQPDAAFIKKNDPSDTAELQRLVRKGYLIRTRADVPLDTVLNRDTTMRDLAFESAAQIVSTDYPAYGMSSRWDWDYAVQLPGAAVARCNPVSAPEGCDDAALE